VETGPEFERLVAFFSSRGTSDAPRRIRTIVIVRVDRAHPVISPGYDHQTSEAPMRARWTRYYVGNQETACIGNGASVLLWLQLPSSCSLSPMAPVRKARIRIQVPSSGSRSIRRYPSRRYR